MSKKRDSKNEEITEIESKIKANYTLDIESFQKLIKAFGKYSDEKIKMVVSQIENFAGLAKSYLYYLNESTSWVNEIFLKHQEILEKQLQKEDSPEIRMQILEDLKDITKRAERLEVIHKFHLDKAAIVGATLLAVAIGALINKDDNNNNIIN